MISKDQIAHNLAIIYMQNRFGVDVNGDFDLSSYDNSSISGSGKVETIHLPSTNTTKSIKVGTGQKNLLGFEKKKLIQEGYLVDDIFAEMINEYYNAYNKFLNLLEKNQSPL